ncbi:hypothetical protein TDB9533_00059 [Thalassocella blandensis]|nr:hypothetical protein TDB9533_00059 [Thalassocella blandensis]
MIGSVNLNHVAPSNSLVETAATSAQNKIQKVGHELNVNGVKPMFAAAAMLAPVTASIQALKAEQSKESDTSSVQKTQKSENNLPGSMLPCRQFLAQLQNMQNKMNELKEKGLSMGNNPDLKDTGFSSLPQGASINIYTR